MAGASGGVGPALAAAAKLPDRVGRCLLSVAPAPIRAAGPDFFAGLGDEARDEARAWYQVVDLEGSDLEAVLQRDYDDTIAFLETVLPTLDLTAADREMFTATIREAVRPGPGGVWDDHLSDINDWGFDVAEVVTSVLLQQAEDDESVPPGHTDWWLRHLRDARLTWLPGGHLGASPGAEERRRGEMELDGLAWAARTG